MANEIRLRSNNVSGVITDNPLTAVAVTINSPGFADLPVVDATSHLILILDPQEVGGTAEIVKVTAHTAASTQVTVLRGQEGSLARSHVFNTTWMHGPVVSDFDVSYTGVVWRTSAQSINNAVWTQVTFDTEVTDVGGMVDIGGAPTRVTATYPGTFVMTAVYQFAANVTGARGGGFRFNDTGTNNPNFYILSDAAAGGLVTAQMISTVFQMNVGDYVELMVFQNSGGALDLDTYSDAPGPVGLATTRTPMLSVARIGS